MGETVELNMREELARIDHLRAESNKFAAETQRLWSVAAIEQERMLVETRKLSAETAKLAAEQQRLLAESAGKFATEQQHMLAEASKFAAEQRKLSAEAAKLDRERWLAPVLAVVALLGGVAGFASAAVTIAAHWGHP